MKHTPGPWEWKQRNWDDPEIVCDDYGLYGANGERVHSDGSASGEYSANIDVNGPDAILMAAAPLMLDALREAYHGLAEHGPTHWRLMGSVSRAIAKATGVYP